VIARLFSYGLPLDDGAAPNPYWGVCTLAICKPQIRSTAEIGDWIAGTGARSARTSNGPARDMSGRVIYAMRVTGKMTMRDYDRLTQEQLTGKIPDWSATDHQLRLGDSIYTWQGNAIMQRTGVHGPNDKERDLSGKFVLLSEHFYYFGAKAVKLPDHLAAIGDTKSAHRMTLNAPLVEPFVAWIDGLGYKPGTVLDEPLYRHDQAHPARRTEMRGERPTDMIPTMSGYQKRG
jgi:hypothetical protein